ncbi:MAG: hypothetical protein V1926_03890 [Candidatus Peregrinibacteria bacterium]
MAPSPDEDRTPDGALEPAHENQLEKLTRLVEELERVAALAHRAKVGFMLGVMDESDTEADMPRGVSLEPGDVSQQVGTVSPRQRAAIIQSPGSMDHAQPLASDVSICVLDTPLLDPERGVGRRSPGIGTIQSVGQWEHLPRVAIHMTDRTAPIRVAAYGKQGALLDQFAVTDESTAAVCVLQLEQAITVLRAQIRLEAERRGVAAEGLTADLRAVALAKLQASLQVTSPSSQGERIAP